MCDLVGLSRVDSDPRLSFNVKHFRKCFQADRGVDAAIGVSMHPDMGRFVGTFCHDKNPLLFQRYGEFERQDAIGISCEDDRGLNDSVTFTAGSCTKTNPKGCLRPGLYQVRQGETVFQFIPLLSRVNYFIKSATWNTSAHRAFTKLDLIDITAVEGNLPSANI